MKKLLFALCFLLAATSTWAAKAYPVPVTITQSDGTQLTIIGHGDEHFNWFTTTDGVLIMQNGRDYVIADIDSDGNMTATTQLAHEYMLRSTNEVSLIKKQNREKFFRAADKTASTRKRISVSESVNPPYFPHTGTPRCLTILVEYSDTTFSITDPKRSFNDYLNAELYITGYDNAESMNIGSVGKYFSDMSDGAFKPQFDVYGPVKLSKAASYYCNNKNTRTSELIKEALNAINDTVDLSQYDNDGDGIIDLVNIIYAGYSGSITGNNTSTCIWPKCGYTTISGSTFDGKTVGRYLLTNELNGYPGSFSKVPYKRINGIGLFCHEFSHALGLPDLYPDNTSAQINNQTMEYWDLMDGGEYVKNGYAPTPYTPWEKEVMQWITIDTLTAEGATTLEPDQAVKVIDDNGSSEYVILHNIQNHGWSSYLLGHGMLIYRINYRYSAVNMGDKPNNTAGKPGITILPADSILITSYKVYTKEKTSALPYSAEEYKNSHYGDPYPGTSAVDSIPFMTLTTTTIEKPILQIKEEGEENKQNISFIFIKDNTETAIRGITTVVAADDKRIFSINGCYMGTDDSQLPKGIYVRNNKKFVVK